MRTDAEPGAHLIALRTLTVHKRAVGAGKASGAACNGTAYIFVIILRSIAMM